MNPDSLMARYWLERERRERGEHTGLRALAPVLSGVVSECCGEKVWHNRRGELVCTGCNGTCDGQSWQAARAQSQQGDGIRTMYVQETRTLDRDREDRQRAREADRFLAFSRLADLIEPRPPRMKAAHWRYLLHAYGWWLLYGPAVAEQLGTLGAVAGAWSESSIVRARDEAREVVRRRTIRHQPMSVCASTRDRAPCEI